MNIQQHDVHFPDVLRCLLKPDPESKKWVGHCLDFDLVTSGRTLDSAWDNLRAVVKLHVEHCFTHHRDGLEFRASENDFAVFDALKRASTFVRTEKITFDLVQPEFDLPPVWVECAEDLAGVICGDSTTTAVPAVH
jgi:predicted RNase H-like HicB family nuclease